MSTDDRSTVKTYVPSYQKEEWTDHATELGMSQSEFVRTMVQAGRADFEIPHPETPAIENGGTPESPTADFRDRIIDELSHEEGLSGEELMERLVGDIQDQIERILHDLQMNNRVLHSTRHGGYLLRDND